VSGPLGKRRRGEGEATRERGGILLRFRAGRGGSRVGAADGFSFSIPWTGPAKPRHHRHRFVRELSGDVTQAALNSTAAASYCPRLRAHVLVVILQVHLLVSCAFAVYVWLTYWLLWHGSTSV
jgi:hypothetical protein